MYAAGAAKLLDGEGGVAGIEEESVDMGRDGVCLVQGFGARYVDDLHQADAWECFAKEAESGGVDFVHELQGVGAAVAVLLDNVFGALFGGEKEGAHSGRDKARQLGDAGFGDDARSAGHGGYQSDGRRAMLDRQFHFRCGADATNLDSNFCRHFCSPVSILVPTLL